LSFGRGKGLTGGSGGALLANDERGATLIDAARKFLGKGPAGWKDVVRATAQWLLARPGVYGVPAALPFLRLGETIYHPASSPGAMSRAALGVVNRVWEQSVAAIEVRRENAARLNAAAARSSRWFTYEVPPDSTGGFLRLPLLVRGGARDDVLRGSAMRLGAMPGYPFPLSRLPGFRERCINADEPFAGAEELTRDLITVPTHGLHNAQERAELERWLANPDDL
jgi:dTDP-4-amino-4,6-dideoxygalactose transaminase